MDNVNNDQIREPSESEVATVGGHSAGFIMSSLRVSNVPQLYMSDGNLTASSQWSFLDKNAEGNTFGDPGRQIGARSGTTPPAPKDKPTPAAAKEMPSIQSQGEGKVELAHVEN